MTAPVLDPVRPAPARRPRPAPPVKRPPARPELRVVTTEEIAEAQRARLVRQLVVAGALVAALCLFGVVVFHVLLTQNQFRLDKLQEQSLERQAEYDKLRLQVAELESPDRIVATAQQRLGMVAPPGVTYLAPTLEDEAVVPGASAAATRRADGDPSAATGAGWSTVKPHLADG